MFLRMYHISLQTSFWATVFSALVPWVGFSLGVSREWENEFVTLGYSVAHTFNLTNCWVCGGPLGLESWPWTSVPISPEWLVSNYSEVENGTYWEEDAPPPWPIRYPAQGQYCLNRTQEGGVFMGTSKCNWTYTYGNHCLIDGCKPVNCSRVRDNPLFLQSELQKYCELFNSTDESFVPRQLGWAWINETGHRKRFSGFWSPVNQLRVTFYDSTLPTEGKITWAVLPAEDTNNCSGSTSKLPTGEYLCWSLHSRRRRDTIDNYSLIYNISTSCTRGRTSGAWFCSVTDPNRRQTWEPYHPLGTSNTTYFQTPWTPTGLFENGTRALKGHYWVCGQHAYKLLPANWTGVCYIGVIHPLFFLLPEGNGKNMGVRLSDDLSRSKRSVNTAVVGGSGQTWGKDGWPLQRIIQHYGPVTWNPSEAISGAQEPVDNLNLIIRLQDALENVSNETPQALGLLADKAAKMRPAALQQRMVHDYLLAWRGGVCGKLNNSNCCLKIDDNGEIIKQIASRIREVAHVPISTGKGWKFDALSWLPGALWIKCILFYMLCGVAMLLF